MARNEMFTTRHRPISLSRGAFQTLAAALGVAVLAGGARADWSMVDAGFKEELNFTVNTWTPAEGLSIVRQGGKLATIPTRDILRLYSGKQVVSDPASRGWRLTLRNGDVLYGNATEISGKSLLFKTPELGVLAVPLKRVSSLSGPVFGPASAGDRTRRLPAATDRDIILFRETGDRLEGFVTGIDDTNLQLVPQGSEAPTPIGFAKIDTIVFGGAKPPREVPPLSVRLAFDTGTVYTVPLEGQENPFQWTLSKVAVKDAAGRECTANTDRLVSVEMVGGRIVYLTELDFAEEAQTSFLGTSWPALLNRNVLGQTMRVSQTNYDRGIGVHTQSTLIYQLDGTFDTLNLRVGLDDSAAPLGEARASIVLDGKVLWQSEKPLKPGQISPELSLPIKGGRRLELRADPTDRLDVQGRVNWVNVAMRRS